MNKTAEHYIAEIKVCIELIQQYTDGINEESFSQDVKLQDAVLRRIQLIGEIAKRIPAEEKLKYSKVDWKSMAGMRDKIVHDYESVDFAIVWDVVINEIPKLKRGLVIV
jgi:uncharacterized protein with HEPN domain